MAVLPLAILGPLLALSASSAETAPSEVDGPKAIKDERVTCKTLHVVDSRIPQKICKPNHVWAEERRAQIEARRSSANGFSSCGDRPPCWMGDD